MFPDICLLCIYLCLCVLYLCCIYVFYKYIQFLFNKVNGIHREMSEFILLNIYISLAWFILFKCS